MDGHWPSRKSTNYFSDTSSKASTAVLEGLEKVADYCDKLDIALVKINDLELVSRFFLYAFQLRLVLSGHRIQPGRATSIGLLSEHYSDTVRRTTRG